MKSLTISENDSGQRLDKFLIKYLKAMPTGLIYKALRKKRVKVNGKREKESYMLAAGDYLELYINDEFFQNAKGAQAFLLLKSPVLEVVYEDENIICVNKPAGLSVHDDESGSPDTLINRILRYLYDKGEYVPNRAFTFTPALAHRIDRNTTGLVLAAKNAAALRVLCDKIKHREIHKTYRCIVCGHMEKPQDTLRAYHKKDETDKRAVITAEKVSGSREMITRYRVLEKYRNHDLCEVSLITGRTHQIRAHFAFVGHPLLGDGKYGRPAPQFHLHHQALCACGLSFQFSDDGGVLSHLNNKEIKLKNIQLIPAEVLSAL